MAVPAVFKEGEMWLSGKKTLEEIVAKLDTGAEAKAAAINAKAPFEVLVVGGGPAGAAAVYTARKGIRTGVAAERFGGQVLDTLGIENFISVPTPKAQAGRGAGKPRRDYEVDIMNLQRAEKLIPAAKGGYHEVVLANGAAEGALLDPVHRRALAQHERAGRKGIRHQGRGLLPALRRPAVQGQARGGDRRRQLRREAAIDLAGIVAHVTLVEFDTPCAPTPCCRTSCAACPTSPSSPRRSPPR
jgi:alkyl hydroperoxide reductase subunit F